MLPINAVTRLNSRMVHQPERKKNMCGHFSINHECCKTLLRELLPILKVSFIPSHEHDLEMAECKLFCLDISQRWRACSKEQL